MQRLKFTKMVASGNDFVVVENSAKPGAIGNSALARKVCHRKFGIGADGMLLLEKSTRADIRMRIFNSDGSEAEMCGNGARCVAQYFNKPHIDIETKAGIIKSKIKDNMVRIKLTDPFDIRQDIPLKVCNRSLRVNFINTGVPHAVIFVQGLEGIDVVGLGRLIRFHRYFVPRGTNVNFIEVSGKNCFSIRTYERGVENETLACGTGSIASALIFALKCGAENKIKVHTRSGDILAVYFSSAGARFTDVWLEGKALVVFKGELCF